jgi:hypothetical protein
MKYVVVVLLTGLTLFSCKKKDDPSLIKVKLSVTGTSVTQFKFNTEGLAASTSVKVPFTGTKDTTVFVTGGKAISLDTKADAATSSPLVGTIYVNDVQVATQTDADTDKDGKTQVKLSYMVPAQ